VKEKLLKKSSELQIKFGRRVDLNEAIDYLISNSEKRPKLLESARRPIHDFESAYQDLILERRKDEERTRRQFGV